jgi:hypothetical protein
MRIAKASNCFRMAYSPSLYVPQRATRAPNEGQQRRALAISQLRSSCDSTDPTERPERREQLGPPHLPLPCNRHQPLGLQQCTNAAPNPTQLPSNHFGMRNKSRFPHVYRSSFHTCTGRRSTRVQVVVPHVYNRRPTRVQVVFSHVYRSSFHTSRGCRNSLSKRCRTASCKRAREREREREGGESWQGEPK